MYDNVSMEITDANQYVYTHKLLQNWNLQMCSTLMIVLAVFDSVIWYHQCGNDAIYGKVRRLHLFKAMIVIVEIMYKIGLLWIL